MFTAHFIKHFWLYFRWSAGTGHFSNPDRDLDQGQPVRGGVLRAVGPVPGGAELPHPLGGAGEGVVQDHGDPHQGPRQAGLLPRPQRSSA